MADCVRGGEILPRTEEEEEEEANEEGAESQAGFGLVESGCVCTCACIHPHVCFIECVCVFLCLHKSCFHSTRPDHDSFFLCESSPFSGTRFSACVCVRLRESRAPSRKNKFPCGLPDACLKA